MMAASRTIPRPSGFDLNTVEWLVAIGRASIAPRPMTAVEKKDGLKWGLNLEPPVDLIFKASQKEPRSNDPLRIHRRITNPDSPDRDPDMAKALVVTTTTYPDNVPEAVLWGKEPLLSLLRKARSEHQLYSGARSKRALFRHKPGLLVQEALADLLSYVTFRAKKQKKKVGRPSKEAIRKEAPRVGSSERRFLHWNSVELPEMIQQLRSGRFGVVPRIGATLAARLEEFDWVFPSTPRERAALFLTDAASRERDIRAEYRKRVRKGVDKDRVYEDLAREYGVLSVAALSEDYRSLCRKDTLSKCEKKRCEQWQLAIAKIQNIVSWKTTTYARRKMLSNRI